ncbi:CDP-alcohol phosphatidyltransferase family protein [Candidatus Roizmanbacteria bacterium]|nr:CDP-alcohol phosphatidyltransferase family protein [Candidatus Roizmanbacteria bacterium]
MLSNKKPLFEQFLEPLIKPFANTNPNVLTLLGSIPSLLFFVFVVLHWYVFALVAFCFNILDFLDGMVARKYHKVTKFGGFLDSVVDRLADFLMIVAFSFAGLVRWEITAPVVLFVFLISYIRSRGELANPAVSFAVGLMERTERLILIIGALILYLFFPKFIWLNFNIVELVFLILLVLSVYTVLQRIIYGYKKL